MDSFPILIRAYEVYKQIIEVNAHLDKRWRYSLGQGLDTSVLQLLSELIMAKNAPKAFKTAYLLKATSHTEIATLKLRLCLELALVNETKIFQAQAKLGEIGRMLGGWIKSLQNQ